MSYYYVHFGTKRRGIVKYYQDINEFNIFTEFSGEVVSIPDTDTPSLINALQQLNNERNYK